MGMLLRNPEIIWRVEKRQEKDVLAALDAGESADDRGTVTLIQSGMMHQLNFIGGTIWKLCDGSRDLEAVVESMASDFDVAREELRADVDEFVTDLVARGWLQRDD